MSPSLAARLADATPWLFLDVAVPGLLLFLPAGGMHPLTLVLSGDLGRLKELVKRGEKLAGLFVRERVNVRDARATAHLVAYSAPDRPAVPPKKS